MADDKKMRKKIYDRLLKYVAAEHKESKDLRNELDAERKTGVAPKRSRRLRKLYRYERRVAKYKEEFFEALEQMLPTLPPDEQEKLEQLMMDYVDEHVGSESKFLKLVVGIKNLF